jgi:hypothetical protein
MPPYLLRTLNLITCRRREQEGKKEKGPVREAGEGDE